MADYRFRETPDAAPNAPLFLVFHGTGGDENQFFDLGGQLLPGARVVAPRGDVNEGGALRFFRRLGNGVYDMDDLHLRTASMIAFIKGQQAKHGASRIVALGYSNGANILASVQFAAPRLIETAVLMHPLIPFQPEPQHFGNSRVLVTAGRHDPMAPQPVTQALADYFTANGAGTSLFWHGGGHELRPEELAEAQRFLTPAR